MSLVHGTQQRALVTPASFFRGRFPQLPPHIPLRLRHQRVWLQAQPHHRLHRPNVLPGPSQRSPEGAEGNYRRSRATNGRRQLQKWLSGRSGLDTSVGEARQNLATRFSSTSATGLRLPCFSRLKLNLPQRLISAFKCCRPSPLIALVSLFHFEVSSPTTSLGFVASCASTAFITVI